MFDHRKSGSPNLQELQLSQFRTFASEPQIRLVYSCACCARLALVRKNGIQRREREREKWTVLYIMPLILYINVLCRVHKIIHQYGEYTQPINSIEATLKSSRFAFPTRFKPLTSMPRLLLKPPNQSFWLGAWLSSSLRKSDCA